LAELFIVNASAIVFIDFFEYGFGVSDQLRVKILNLIVTQCLPPYHGFLIMVDFKPELPLVADPISALMLRQALLEFIIPLHPQLLLLRHQRILFPLFLNILLPLDNDGMGLR